MIVCQRSSTLTWSTCFSTLPRTFLTQETWTSPTWHHALACRPRPPCIQCKHTPVGIHLVESYNLLGSMFHLISISTQLIPRRLLPPSGSSELSSRNIRTGNSKAQGPVYHSLIIRMGQGGWGARWNPKGPSHENRMEYEGGGGRMLRKVQDH